MSAFCLSSARACWFLFSPLPRCRTQLTLHARNSFAATDTLSAWIVSFMVSKRSSPAAATRYVLAGVWAGIAAGRVLLSWLLNRRLGEKAYSILLLVCACAFLGVLYVRDFVVDAGELSLVLSHLARSGALAHSRRTALAPTVAVVLVGFFIGPVTPKVLDVVGARVPPSLKASTMSLTIGLGASLLSPSHRGSSLTCKRPTQVSWALRSARSCLASSPGVAVSRRCPPS